MPDEYFFRGTIPQYWNIVYAEYQRLYRSLGREPFEFTAPCPHTQPLGEYVPVDGSVILISFWNTERTYEITVDAEFSPTREMVQVMVFYQGPITREGESALAMWKEVKHALEEDEMLADMAKLVGKPAQHQKPEFGSPLDAWFDYYHNMRAAGYKCTLKDIARETSYNAGYITSMHSNYLRERELAQSRKRHDKK